MALAPAHVNLIARVNTLCNWRVYDPGGLGGGIFRLKRLLTH